MKLDKNEIFVTKSSLPGFKEFCDEIKPLWDTHFLTNMGVKHQKLEEQLEDYLNSQNVVLYTNGHLALENAISVYDFKPGSEIITTPYTFASTTHAIIRNNLKPVFCDIDINNYCIDSNKIEKLITEKTVAILPVHVYGNICNIEQIDDIAKKYNLKVIYDAAHAFGTRYKNINVSNFGDITMFSFHATKVFNTIEGGCLCFKDSTLKKQLNDNKNFGIRDAENVVYAGGNAKMNEFQAAMGICNLRHVDQEIKNREFAFNKYLNYLKNIKDIKLPKINTNTYANFSYFPILVNSKIISRDSLYEELKKSNITARKYFYPLTCDFECYKNKKYKGTDKLQISRFVSDNILTLPLYASLKDREIKKISSIICNLFK